MSRLAVVLCCIVGHVSAAAMRLPPARLFRPPRLHKISQEEALKRVEEEWMHAATDVNDWEPLLVFMTMGSSVSALSGDGEWTTPYEMYELRDEHDGGIPWMAAVEEISPLHFRFAHVVHHPALKSETLWCDDAVQQELAAALCVFEGRRAVHME